MELETENHFCDGKIDKGSDNIIAGRNKRTRSQSRVNAIFVKNNWYKSTD